MPARRAGLHRPALVQLQLQLRGLSLSISGPAPTAVVGAGILSSSDQMRPSRRRLTLTHPSPSFRNGRRRIFSQIPAVITVRTADVERVLTRLAVAEEALLELRERLADCPICEPRSGGLSDSVCCRACEGCARRALALPVHA
jgi:hypothetical protein